MEEQTSEKLTFAGTCVFCKAEVAKNKMTQHLKFCKGRLATIATQEKKASKPKTRLFHILAEGQYSPQYWLHFEIPASEPLWMVDNFLKDMWIDDLDHLSGFTINGTNYSDIEDFSDNILIFPGAGEDENKSAGISEAGEDEEISEEELAQKLSMLLETAISSYSKSYLVESLSAQGFSLDSQPLWTEWVEEVKKPRSIDEFIDFLKAEVKRIEKAERSFWNNTQNISEREKYVQNTILRVQSYIAKDILDEIEDRSMNVLLQRILSKVGQKFSYTYDYGTSTNINLRVIAEREGIVQEEEPVQLLAQNNAYSFPCVECGKPATMVAVGYFASNIEGNMYCAECAEKYGEDGGLLPITNSPRSGVL